MSSLGFENYAEALKIYLSKYREVGLSLTSLHLLFLSPSVSGHSRRLHFAPPCLYCTRALS